MTYAAFTATATATLDILDFAVWMRNLTDTEAAAVADDIRGQLYPSSTNGTGTGTPASISLTAPVGSASGTSSGTNGTGTGTPHSISLTAPIGAASGTSPGAGTITIPDIKDLTTGGLRPNETGITVIVNDKTTGALVVKLTGQTTDASGDCVISSASITAAVQYRCTTILSDGSEGTWLYTAA
jgi:hypothetical protein